MKHHEMVQKSSPPPSNATPALQPLFLCSAVLPGAPAELPASFQARWVAQGEAGCAQPAWHGRQRERSAGRQG